VKPVQLQLPDEAHIVGELYPPGDARLLTDGMLHVGLHGLCIDVSWYPEHDPDGEYIVTVYQDSWENKVREPLVTRDPGQVASFVERAAAEALVRVPDDEANGL
jgi:hypothetical protein